MGTHKPEYIVNIKFTGGKSQKEITDAYTRFYVGVVLHVLESSSMSLDKKNEMLDAIIKKLNTAHEIEHLGMRTFSWT